MSQPVRLCAFDPAWASDFDAEATRLAAGLDPAMIALHHIGSTAVPGLVAKPIIDMMAEVASVTDVDARAERICNLGYQAMGAFGIPGRRYFRKDRPDGQRTHHLHAFEAGSPHITRHLAFRDYLRAHPAEAKAYGALKQRLLRDGQTGWDAYQDGKDTMVRAVEAKALTWWRHKTPT